MSRIADEARKFIEPEVASLGLELWNVEFVKEAGTFFLRVFIDREGGIAIDDCEAVSKLLDAPLDEHEPLFPEEGYTFEVSSAGAERKLRSEADYPRFNGKTVEVSLYKAKYGASKHIGKLAGYENETLTIEAQNTGTALEFTKNEIASVKLRVVV
ncbi:MAG: ribosome maturation factor RimP [Oscillospiraceae bacterium]|nr:ribosome maturation factor RimP [Oscillospiraceae bacterium]